MQQDGVYSKAGSGVSYALVGFLLGTFAPVGWGLLRLTIFGSGDQGLWHSFFADMVSDPYHQLLYLYMGFGTAVVLAVFGYFIGRSHHLIQQRARRLDELNLTIAEQKKGFEQRFRDLNNNLKNFHATNTHIQKSIDPTQVVRLAAESLHEILQYDRVNILMLDKTRSHLDFLASRGTGDDDVAGLNLPFDQRAGVLYKALTENRIFLIEDVRKLPENMHLQPPCDEIEQLRSRSFIICPISVNGVPVGLFGVDNKVKHKALDDTDVDTVRLFANQVSAALTKIELLAGMETLTGELEKTFANILRHRDTFSQLIEALQEGSSATALTISRASAAAQTIRSSVDDTSSAATEISAAIAQVAQNLVRLNSFMENSISAMTEISSSSMEVERSAERSQQMSEKVKVQAEQGVDMVSNAYHGLQNVSTSVDDSVRTIEELSAKSAEIDRIIAVINDINAKTHLLSLNASIIAAQAGDQGRSFAVVADEIRTLSEETTQSAGAIEKLVADIQSYTGEAVRQINDTRSRLDEGIRLGRSTAEALSNILESSVEAMEMSEKIRLATTEQVRSSQMVARSIEELGGMSGQVTTASREQEQGIGRIAHAISEIKVLADELAEATQQNEDAIRRTDAAVDSVSEMAALIFAEMADKSLNSRQIIESLARLKQQDDNDQPGTQAPSN